MILNGVTSSSAAQWLGPDPDEIAQSSSNDDSKEFQWSWLDDESKFVECLKTKEGSRGLQAALDTPLREKIVTRFESLTQEEVIVQLSTDMWGNYFISEIIRHIGGKQINDFVDTLISHPDIIYELVKRKFSYRVIMDLLITRQSLTHSDEFKKTFLKLASKSPKDGFYPFLIQQWIKHDNKYKKEILEQIKNGEFQIEEIGKKVLIFLGMYSEDDIGDYIHSFSRSKMSVPVAHDLDTKGWEYIHERTKRRSILRRDMGENWPF